MRIYIIGSVASGKSTLAKKLSDITSVPYTSLDSVVYEKDETSEWGDRKRPVEKRDRLFGEILCSQEWIIEDTGRGYFAEGLRQAGTILYLEPSSFIRNFRIVKRWIKQRIGIEKCIYKPRIAMLKCMLEWSKDYDNGKDGIKNNKSLYPDKTVILRNNKEVDEFIRSRLG